MKKFSIALGVVAQVLIFVATVRTMYGFQNPVTESFVDFNWLLISIGALLGAGSVFTGKPK